MFELSERRKALSPLPRGGNLALNVALDWKIWVKIDDNERLGNSKGQATAIEFTESDTIDDLKTKLLTKLNNSRWSRENDTCSITIGFYLPIKNSKVTNNNNINNNANTSLLSIESNQRIHTERKKVSPGLHFYMEAPLSRMDSHNGLHYENSSKNRSSVSLQSLRQAESNNIKNESHSINSTSPPLIFHSSSNINLQYLAPTPTLGRLSPINTSQSTNYLDFNNLDLKWTSIRVNDSNVRITFEPDELIKNIYLQLYGSLGAQKVSEALLIFSSGIPTNENNEISPTVSFDFNDYVPTNDEITEQMLRSPYYGENLMENEKTEGFKGEEGLIKDGSRFGSCDSVTQSLSGKEKKFKLITNEEQLRKVSEDLGSEKNVDSPKQAILLLPKNFNEENNLRNKTGGGSSSTISSFVNKTNDEIMLSTQEGTASTNDSGISDGGVEPRESISNSSTNTNSNTIHNNDNSNPIISSSAMIAKSTSSNYSSAFQDASVPIVSHPEFKITGEKVFPKINVLIVEDNVINQTILASFLRKHKISYKVAKNGREAVDKWKEGGLHLIFMDLQLPVLSGIDAAKEIREYEKHKGIGIQKASSTTSTTNLEDTKKIDKNSTGAPVIIVAFTASNSLTDKREALISGCNDYLTKPVNLHWLSKKITEWGCMQGLIDFDNWKQGQSRMTDSVLVKQTPKLTKRKSSSKSPLASTSSSPKISAPQSKN
ncbi:hypothetical protein Kpol_1004p4 [Vanderwaltozyma polyspora DSM 70294]|uniref:Response regulatory domain-containing protein n=1 Tax=Vanderwaltozyma polyspora (strain ATCC 22028 / DSM 70294 / BCRC 21397 / CBS 2163 / NBRC 10782 / NRRL Y-8283 / UCD 57-17) TaxID=436907 RepID=A7TJ63_VANPO|nr:uncharacterized protein Kpol_1004p4 [Vanderwaltozyma polyspora DSM 70294]EDO17632.1 hypothetical protein Kpol_1004p4 [Vanderwaltozyma polyspora DSM 70294]